MPCKALGAALWAGLHFGLGFTVPVKPLRNFVVYMESIL